MSYLDLDDILATQQKLPCKFEQHVPRMGRSMPGSSSDDVSVGSKLDLPLWLAKALSDPQRPPVVTVDTPKPYQRQYRNVLVVDPHVVDLHKLGPYFFAVGRHFLEFASEDRAFIAESLLRAFLGRFAKVDGLSAHTIERPMPRNLDKSEERLYALGQASLKECLHWQSRTAEQIEVADMVLTLGRRKRVHD